MLAKFLVRAAVVGGAVAGAVHLIRKHDLVTKGATAAEGLIDKVSTGAENLVVKAVGLTDELLSRFADDPTPTTDAGVQNPTGGARAEDVDNDVWAAATRDGDVS